jgi:hypothetical protein
MKNRSTVHFSRNLTHIGSVVGALALVATVGVVAPSGAAVKATGASAHSSLTSQVVKKLAFKGSYSGSLTFLLTSVASTSTAASVTSVTGKGTATDLGTGSSSLT